MAPHTNFDRVGLRGSLIAQIIANIRSPTGQNTYRFRFDAQQELFTKNTFAFLTYHSVLHAL